MLVDAIRQVHEQCAAQASRAVNVNLTLRNWVIGGYIHHYELNGRDRAKYGEAMIDRLATELAKRGVTACERQRFYSYLVSAIKIFEVLICTLVEGLRVGFDDVAQDRRSGAVVRVVILSDEASFGVS